MSIVNTALQVVPMGSGDPGTYYLTVQPISNGLSSTQFVDTRVKYAPLTGNLFSPVVSAGAIYTNGLFWSGNGQVIQTGGGSGAGITYTSGLVPPSTGNKVGDQWYSTGTDVLYEYSSDGLSSFWLDVTTPAIASSNTAVTTFPTLAVSSALSVNGNVTFTGNIIGNVSSGTAQTTSASVGFIGLPVTQISSPYTLALSDQGKMIYITANASVTIPANASVAFPVGTVINLFTGPAAYSTISITSDSLYLTGVSTGSSGSRSMVPYSSASMVKLTSTLWIINGIGLS